ncbi:DUF3892 domain-containing protein [Pseudalkalibacillus hwajinpoensis]|uniref:DUF3892 domain-containing protein n=1 Tax=Guptibacillus hwajinpoensis TaxID=208199 RepID=A0A4U1MKY8_9BACL|nr:DUF3892 domain-containing protein [Pseudalkalibacillus hwajinpoensis]TKD71843.1 DUF3892 domain-containing protein [Pseudalkalibacillus hwajinpoensis]
MDRFDKAYQDYLNNGQPSREIKPLENTDGMRITAVRKNDDGDLIAFQTNTGEELDYLQALEAANNGTLAGVDVFQKYGRDIIRSEPDSTKENNLDHLPEF